MILNKKEWEKISNEYFHSYCPEYRIKTNFKKDGEEFYSYVMTNHKTSYYDLKLLYRGEKLEEYQAVYLDSGRLFVPVPDWESICDNTKLKNDKITYKFYIEDSLKYRLLRFFLGEENTEETFALQKFTSVVLIYTSQEEKQYFEEYIENNFEEFSKEKKGLSSIDYNDLKMRKYREEISSGIVLNALLKRWRAKSNNGIQTL